MRVCVCALSKNNAIQPERLTAGRPGALLLLLGCTGLRRSAEVACEAAELQLEQILFSVAALPANFI